MALITKNSIDILEGVKMLMMITTICCREDQRRSNWTATASSKRTDATKDYWSHRYDTNSKSSSLFLRRSYMRRKIDVRLAQRRKLCSGKKDQVAQLKCCTIMIWPIRLGMAWSGRNSYLKKIVKSCWTVVQTRFSYRCLWVINNSEPMKNCNQWECSTWWRTRKKLCSSKIISRYRGR